MAQLGSALDWGSRGRRFKSCQPDHKQRLTDGQSLFIFLADMWAPPSEKSFATRLRCDFERRGAARLRSPTPQPDPLPDFPERMAGAICASFVPHRLIL